MLNDSEIRSSVVVDNNTRCLSDDGKMISLPSSGVNEYVLVYL